MKQGATGFVVLRKGNGKEAGGQVKAERLCCVCVHYWFSESEVSMRACRFSILDIWLEAILRYFSS